MSPPIPSDDLHRISLPDFRCWKVGLNDVDDHAPNFSGGEADIWVLKDHHGVCHGSNAPDAEEKLRAVFARMVEEKNVEGAGRTSNGRMNVWLECNFLPVSCVGFPLWKDKPEVTPYFDLGVCRGPLGQARRVAWYSGYYRWMPEQIEGVSPDKALRLIPGWDCYEKDQQIPELAEMLPPPLGLAKNGETWAVVSLLPGKVGVLLEGADLLNVLRDLQQWTIADAEKWRPVRRKIHPNRNANVGMMEAWWRLLLRRSPWGR